ncbi:MAG: hypothetical protein U0401_34390 [Anaerolineae bacterium]
MSDDPTANKLTEMRHIVLVIRLLVDQNGQLRQGVLVDVNQQTIGQFRQLDKLPDTITTWLKTWARQQKP